MVIWIVQGIFPRAASSLAYTSNQSRRVKDTSPDEITFVNSIPLSRTVNLLSAVANAENNAGADIDELKVSRTYVDEAVSVRRFRARARGRSAGIIKRSCHIIVEVSDDLENN